MSGESEATGEDAPGGDGLTHERHCLNCGTLLTGTYCHACGQHAHVHRTLGALGHDLLHGVLHLEGKVWRTLPLLAWNPGALTRRYIHGERARFVSPLALFLFAVFLMFAVFGSIGGPFGDATTPSGARNDVTTALRTQQARLTALKRERAAAAAAQRPVAPFDARIRAARDELANIEMARSLSEGTSGAVIMERLNIDLGSPERDARVREALKDPQLLLYKLQTSAYKFAWALVPLSLPFLWLMFAWRREYHLYDHAVFVTYSLSAVILLTVVMALIAVIGIDTDWLLFLIPAHFFVQLKGAYRLSKASAAWRTVALIFVAATALVIFGALLLVFGLLG